MKLKQLLLNSKNEKMVKKWYKTLDKDNSIQKDPLKKDYSIVSTLIKKLFVPSTCLQGTELPVHLLWQKDKLIQVEIIVPNSIEVLRVNNAINPYINNNVIVINNFEENGYVGLIFKTNMLPNHSIDEKFIFKICSSNGEMQVEEKFVHLFRPSINIKSIPDRAFVSISKGQSEETILSIDNKIQVSNLGEGIAIISFKITDESELKIESSKNENLFQVNFINDLIKELLNLNTKYENYNNVINDIIFILNNPVINLSKDQIEKLKLSFDEFDKILENDENFNEDFTACVKTAILKNLSVLVNVESFITYLKSIESNNVILQNPIGILNVTECNKTFKAELNIMDLGYNKYPSIPVEFEICSNSDIELPIHMLVNFDKKDELFTLKNTIMNKVTQKRR